MATFMCETKKKDGKSVGLLRFSTAGSVDDGKSTLIGRLLFDTKQIFEDQLEALQRSSDLTGGGEINLANLTDGLRAEREQGITIDVAYHYFATPKRKFICADTPGHIQYTRNMVTGASTAEVALLLIDGRRGVVEQSRRHAYISSLLKVPYLVVCVNKMDLVSYSQERFNSIRQEFRAIAEKFGFEKITFIPISALIGDNVVERSTHMEWYDGPSLVEYLENLEIKNDNSLAPRFPVQYVIRSHGSSDNKFRDFRGFAGQIVSGSFSVGDSIVVLPSGKRTQIKEIHTLDGSLRQAIAPKSVSLMLEDELDIGRGDMVVRQDSLPRVIQELDAMVCWMSDQPMVVGQKYYLKHLTRNSRCVIQSIDHVIDMKTLDANGRPQCLNLNDIGLVSLKLMQSLAVDSYEVNRATGGFILIDETTNNTVAAGMIRFSS